MLAQASPRRFHEVAIVSLKDSRWKEPEYLIDSDISIVDTSGNKPKICLSFTEKKMKASIKRMEMFSNY